MADHYFPDNFKFGVATSAYQIEGAWDKDGKSESIWDYQVHTFPERIKDGSNGDIACDSYHKMDEDIANMKHLGVHFYRFSIAWCRILPTGFPNRINQPGVDYYNRLIDKLLAAGIEPVVTIYHWDLPQKLQELGGWTNLIIADYFVSYARICFAQFGDRVKTWITFNEPMQITYFGYSTAILAPFYHLPGIGSYLAGHTLLIAHGRTYRMYVKEFKELQGGRVGITIESPWTQACRDCPEDVEAAERLLQMYLGWFAHPIFSQTGDYPPVMRVRIDTKSKAQGFDYSRLPKFTAEEVILIRGSSDFFGLNHYNTILVTNNPTTSGEPSEPNDWGLTQSFDPAWPSTARHEFKIVPHGIRNILNWIRNEYGNPEVIITENGYAGHQDEGLEDKERIGYMQKYIRSVLMAIQDGCHVSAYTMWTLIDNYEWSDGYTMRFGLFRIDFDEPGLPRTAKHSAEVYRQIIATRTVQEDATL